jgi:hypothetical protein
MGGAGSGCGECGGGAVGCWCVVILLVHLIHPKITIMRCDMCIVATFRSLIGARTHMVSRTHASPTGMGMGMGMQPGMAPGMQQPGMGMGMGMGMGYQQQPMGMQQGYPQQGYPMQGYPQQGMAYQMGQM